MRIFMNAEMKTLFLTDNTHGPGPRSSPKATKPLAHMLKSALLIPKWNPLAATSGTRVEWY